MRSAAAYTSKLKAQSLGRTFKVQDTNHRLFTTTLYRGTAGCGPVDYTQLHYVELCRCNAILPVELPPIPPPVIPPPVIPPPVIPDIPDGGNPSQSGDITYDGGTPSSSSNSSILDGGSVGLYMPPDIPDGGNPSQSGGIIYDGGSPSSSGLSNVDGGG